VKKTVLVILGVTVGLMVGCASTGFVTYTGPDDWTQKSMGPGPMLPLGKAAGEWSEAKTFKPTSGELAVKSKFVKHYGTTCIFDVEFKNTGSTTVNESVVVSSVMQTKIPSHRFNHVSLKAGESVAYNMERRECPLHFGDSVEMKDCADCNPILIFER